MRHINCICPGLIRDTVFSALRENDSDWLFVDFGGVGRWDHGWGHSRTGVSV